MPRQPNYRSDIENVQDSRFTASRIVRVTSELIYYEELPASFAFDNEDNIEIHFYTIPGNELILSTLINISENILKSHIVSYADGTYKNYLRLDMTKLFVDKNLVLIPGDYFMVMNFFSDEIGNYNNRNLNLDIVSPSRTEVQLSFSDTTDEITFNENLRLLKEFIEPSFNKPDAVGAAEKIFKAGATTGDIRVGMTADAVVNKIDVPVGQSYANTMARIDRINLRNVFDKQVNDFLPELFKYIREEIVINSDERVQQDDYRKLINDVVKKKIANLQQTLDNRIRVS
jgi:hypothetical protein